MQRGDLAALRRPHGLTGVAAALAAAVLFGVGVPLAKLLVGDVAPLVLGALLYLGAAAALIVWGALARSGRPALGGEPALRRQDLPLLFATSVLGGVVAPLLLLAGLRRLPGVVASLLLNLEAPFTILLAIALFHEHLGRRGAIGAAFVVAGAAIVSGGSLHGGNPMGALAVAGACLAWAVDNNLMQRLSARDPAAIVRAKGILAGASMGVLAFATGDAWPPPATIAAALALGATSYGASLMLALVAMRSLGAARQAAYFATAPFIGTCAAVPLLGERMGIRELAAAAIMAVGVRALVNERHAHRHVHAAVQHEHQHEHDGHHRHAHGPADPPGEPHAHPHRHAALEHEHDHVSDLHHRHRH